MNGIRDISRVHAYSYRADVVFKLPNLGKSVVLVEGTQITLKIIDEESNSSQDLSLALHEEAGGDHATTTDTWPWSLRVRRTVISTSWPRAVRNSIKFARHGW